MFKRRLSAGPGRGTAFDLDDCRPHDAGPSSSCVLDRSSHKGVVSNDRHAPVEIVDLSHCESSQKPDTYRAVKREGNPKTGLAQIRSGCLQDGSEALSWTILRPEPRDEAKACANGAAQQRRSKREIVDSVPQCAGAGERAVKRLRTLKRQAPAAMGGSGGGLKKESSSRASTVAAAQLSEKAVVLLSQALGDSTVAQQTAHAIAAAFCAVRDSNTSCIKRQLLALVTALRTNEDLRKAILEAGPSCATNLAKQDAREWANAEMQRKRAQWIKESFKEATRPGGEIGVCPECGGQAVVECGRAGSGRAARISKEYYHYSCMEEGCGKSTHIQQG